MKMITSLRTFAAIVLVTLALPLTSEALTSDTEFAGAFIVEHVSTLKLDQGIIQVDVVGSGCITHGWRAYCDNNNTQVISLADNSGTAVYTLRMPGGSLKLKLTAESDKAGGNPIQGIRYGGSFVVLPNSGTGCFKGASGSGVWMGSAEFTGPLVPGINAPGPGRWAFWGTLTRK